MVSGAERFCVELRQRMAMSERKVAQIEIAYVLAKYGHEHKRQKRDSGTRYFDHPKAVACMLVDLCEEISFPCAPDMVIAALLHDLVEDTFMLQFCHIEEIFNKTVRNYVDAVTKRDDETLQQRHGRIARAPIRARLIKIADRLHNVQTLTSCSREKQERMLSETRGFYVGLADGIDSRLGDRLRNACVFIATALDEK